ALSMVWRRRTTRLGGQQSLRRTVRETRTPPCTSRRADGPYCDSGSTRIRARPRTSSDTHCQPQFARTALVRKVSRMDASPPSPAEISYCRLAILGLVASERLTLAE